MPAVVVWLLMATGSRVGEPDDNLLLGSLKALCKVGRLGGCQCRGRVYKTKTLV